MSIVIFLVAGSLLKSNVTCLIVTTQNDIDDLTCTMAKPRNYVLMNAVLTLLYRYLEKNEEHIFRTQYYLASEEYCQQADQ